MLAWPPGGCFDEPPVGRSYLCHDQTARLQHRIVQACEGEDRWSLAGKNLTQAIATAVLLEENAWYCCGPCVTVMYDFVLKDSASPDISRWCIHAYR